MIISKISTNNIIGNVAYYCLHAEVAYQHHYYNSVGGSFLGADSVRLPISIIECISKDILLDKINSVFVLDFDGIEDLQLNADNEISDLRNIHKKVIVLANIKESVVNQSSSLKYFLDANQNYKEGERNSYSFFSFGEIDCNLLSDSESVFIETFAAKLKRHLHNEIKDHHSSSVRISSYIDIKQLIAQEKSFVLLCIYRLARKMRSKFDWKDNKPVLICQSLNGSYIASVLSLLLGLNLFVLDGIGPVNKLYPSLGSKIVPGKRYLVVSDVVCLGTEVKITKNIIEYLGGVYFGNVSIVRIASIKDYDNVESVFCINKNNKDDFNYRIITPLD